jgi:glyoxylase-like metal-dependent hydrolase (beta-lactamase superfamily II)
MLIKDPPVQVAEGLWMLGSNEYPLYLVRGQGEAAIFEGGVGCMGPLVLEQMDRLGIERETVKQLVIPHAHPDHVMAVPLLREALPQLSVAATEPAAGVLGNEKAISFFLKIDGALTESLLRKGVIAEEHRPKPLAENKIAVDRLLGAGETISVDGFSFNVLSTPGHSDDSLSFHEPGRGILLVSDAVGYYMPDHNAWWPDYFTGYRTYLESIERLAALGAEILCLGHQGVVKGADAVKAHLDGSIEAAKQYHGRIVEEVKSGKPARQIAEQLGSEVYEKTPLLPVEFFQKNCNLLVKQSMKEEGIEPEK